jgi:hypothetical protein
VRVDCGPRPVCGKKGDQVGERTILVCDECGRPAVESVTFRARGRNRVKDFCETHLAALLDGSRAPRRGRRAGTVTLVKSAAKRRGRRPGAVVAAPAKRRVRLKKTTTATRRPRRARTTAAPEQAL